jgi:hypothetical protein
MIYLKAVALREPLLRRESEWEEEEYEDCDQFYSINNKMKRRRLSLAGVLDQSDAEIRGFAALLTEKLHQVREKSLFGTI